MARLLAIDDETAVLTFYRSVLEKCDLSVDLADNFAEGLAQFNRRRPDVVLLDVELPDRSGLEAFKRFRAIDAKVPILFVTGGNKTESAIEAMKLGAFEYLLKPIELEHLRNQVAQALDVARQMRIGPGPADDPTPADAPDAFVGRCRAMQEVYKSIGRVAPQAITVMVRGASGTGKELVARAIYHHSRRSAGPFRAINCAAIPEALLESELFGHEKGAFTGATQKRIGKFEQCRDGTLFLDEVGDMSPLTQAKVLRVLQDQEFERIGGNEVVHTNVRLIAATNRDLERMVEAGQFREDLYYRLNVFAIRLPTLAERRDDLPLLVDHFSRRFCSELIRDVVSVPSQTLELLKRYEWPGNIRELQSVLKRALLQTTGPVLLPQFLPAFLQEAPAPPLDAAAVPPTWSEFLEQHLSTSDGNLYAQWLDLTDRFMLGAVLQHTRGNVSQAARILGINRGTLSARLDALDLAAARHTCHRGDEVASSRTKEKIELLQK